MHSSHFSNPPAYLVPWLQHPFSLTQRLKEKTSLVKLNILAEEWRMPNLWELNLGIKADLLWCREIKMLAQQVPCWYARTSVPQSTHENHQDFFSRLQHESLGELIFSTADVKRKALHIYGFDKTAVEYDWLKRWNLSDEKILWARVSTFEINETDRFFLLEVFLPEIMRYSN